MAKRSTRLTIGILRLRPGWRILLEQLGPAYEVIRKWDDVTPARFSAIIIDDVPDSAELQSLAAYAAGGGALLDAGHYLRTIQRDRIERRRIHWVTPSAGDNVFGHIGLTDIHAPAWVHRDANHLGGTIYLGEHGGGPIASLAFDPGALLRNTQSVRAQFHIRTRPYPNEIVARVSRGELRGIAEAALRWLHARRELPYVHRWRFPGHLPSIFSYRIDSDYGTREQIASLHSVAREHDIRMTWFLHTQAHEGWLDAFAAMRDQEMALHGFRHRTFRSYEENRANIAEAAALLEREGIPFTGFAAPNGFWNINLARAVADAGLIYSSEFSLDYDDLPFHPVLYGDFSPALQVPIHPICIGSMVRVKIGPGTMKEYFRDVIERRFRLREPIILYHHPGHEHWDVMADSLQRIRELGITNITMGEYAAWWLRREQVRFEAWSHDDAIEASFKNMESDVELAVRDTRGRYGFIREQGTWGQEAITWNDAPEPMPAPSDIGTIRRWNPVLLRHSIEDLTSRARQ